MEKAFATALGERKLDASITRTEASAAIMVTTISTPAILSDGGPGANAASIARNLRAVNLSRQVQDRVEVADHSPLRGYPQRF